MLALSQSSSNDKAAFTCDRQNRSTLSDMRATILLVEDDVVARDSAAFTLRRAGYLVFTAASLTETSLYLERTHPDLILLDIVLPDGDGLDLGRRLRARGIPFMVVTGRSTAHDVTRSLAAGAVDYLLKPFSLDELTGRVATALRGAGPRGNDDQDAGHA